MPELIGVLSVLTTLPGMLSLWKDGPVCLLRGLGHKSSETVSEGQRSFPGVGGGRQGEEMSKKPAYRAHVSPGEITEVKQSEG